MILSEQFVAADSGQRERKPAADGAAAVAADVTLRPHAAPAGPGGPATRSNPLPASTTTARSSPTPRTPPPADRADGYRGAGGRTVGGAVVAPGPLLRARKPWRNRIHSLAVVPAHPQLSARDCAVGDRGIVGPRAADVGRSGDVHTAA